MRTKTVLVFLVLTIWTSGQDTSTQTTGPVEVFFNVSNALVRATGNFSTSTVLDEPYLIGLKARVGENKAIRFGTNFNFSTREDFTDNFFIRTTTEQVIAVNLGLEWRRKLNKNFVYYYGADLRYQADNSISDARTSIGDQRVASNKQGPGASPFFGIAWHINDRISVFTESHIVVSQILTDRYLVENGYKQVLERGWSLDVKPIPPGAIFISINL